MQCVILAGGRATRMGSATARVPKVLLPVGGRPFADLQLSWLSQQGVSDVVFCIGHLGDQVRRHVGAGRRWGLRVAYADEGENLRGTAGALRHAGELGLLEPTFLVLYGDSYLDVDARAVLGALRASQHAAVMTVFRNDGQWDRSNVRWRDGVVELYDKRATDPAACGMAHIDYGLLAMRREAIMEWAPATGAADLAELQHELSVQGRVGGYEATRRFYEIGSPSGLAELEAALLAP